MQEKPASAPTRGQVGNITLVESTAQVGGDKVIVATYLFRAMAVEPKEAMVAFGSSKIPRSEAKDYQVILVDHQGNVLAQYGIWNPRKLVVEKQGLVENPEATYSARFPFDARAKEVRVLDSQGVLVAKTEVGSVIREFCAKLKHDKDCP